MEKVRSTRIILLTITLIAWLMTTSCAVSKKIYLPDGSDGYSISCDGAAVGINVCFEKAGEICGSRGYDIINREGQIIPFGTGTATNNHAVVTYGAFNTKSIMIRCK